MSWFGPELEHDVETDLEVADGVVVERRSVLWLSAAAVASVLSGGTALAAQGKVRQDPERAKAPGGKLPFDRFLAEVYPLAKKIVASKGEDEEAYLMTVAAVMSRLADPGAEMRATMRKFVEEHKQDGERFPLSAMAMRLKPGRGFPHHDHRDYNGVIMGLEGEVRIRNFDILGDELVPPEGNTFQIRETRDDLILPGRFSSLARRRDNVHELVAGKDGARVLDVFTFFGKRARSVYMNVEDKPRDPERRIYDAAWKPSRRRGRRRDG